MESQLCLKSQDYESKFYIHIDMEKKYILFCNITKNYLLLHLIKNNKKNKKVQIKINRIFSLLKFKKCIVKFKENEK